MISPPPVTTKPPKINGTASIIHGADGSLTISLKPTPAYRNMAALAIVGAGLAYGAFIWITADHVFILRPILWIVLANIALFLDYRYCFDPKKNFGLAKIGLIGMSRIPIKGAQLVDLRSITAKDQPQLCIQYNTGITRRLFSYETGPEVKRQCAEALSKFFTDHPELTLITPSLPGSPYPR